MDRRTFLGAAFVTVATPAAFACGGFEPIDLAEDGRRDVALVAAARQQIGTTVTYDPAYVSLKYPGGDVPADRGVCTDVVIRAYRDGLNLDLQKLVHEDMRENFVAYPKTWGLKSTDRNIDHRRVPNLAVFFKRKGAALAISDKPEDFAAGDLVTMMLPGNLPHIGMVSDMKTSDGKHPLFIHNIGRGTQEEDVLFAYTHTGRFRFGLKAVA
jgi:uncharacterized protein